MQNKTITYDELVSDYEFSPASYLLSDSIISKYVAATDSIFDGSVPPLAITALALTAMTGFFSLPSDAIAIHASQELEFFKPVPIGATIECRAKVARKLSRGQMRMLVLELSVFDQSKEKVQSGKTTIVLTN